MHDAMVTAAIGDLDAARDSGALPGSTVAALRLADVLTSGKPEVTPEFQTELREHFSDVQILELGSALSVASGWQSFIEAFGIRPDSWNSSQEPPVTPGG